MRNGEMGNGEVDRHRYLDLDHNHHGSISLYLLTGQAELCTYFILNFF